MLEEIKSEESADGFGQRAVFSYLVLIVVFHVLLHGHIYVFFPLNFVKSQSRQW